MVVHVECDVRREREATLTPAPCISRIVRSLIGSPPLRVRSSLDSTPVSTDNPYHVPVCVVQYTHGSLASLAPRCPRLAPRGAGGVVPDPAPRPRTCTTTRRRNNIASSCQIRPDAEQHVAVRALVGAGCVDKLHGPALTRSSDPLVVSFSGSSTRCAP
jgi:hypothetical protein